MFCNINLISNIFYFLTHNIILIYMRSELFFATYILSVGHFRSPIISNMTILEHNIEYNLFYKYFYILLILFVQ